jgi:predicted MFS family arabinose efflux permease
LIRGQSNDWADTAAWIAIVVGAVALVLFPILMATRPNPLVPLDLFRQRTFATINLATFFVYGALYVTITFQALVLQGVLGYTALAAGAVGIPVGIMLSVLSTWIGTLAARLGARRFLVGGPMLMAAAMLWYARLPADSAPWKAAVESPETLIPPVSTLVDVLPSVLVFGLGISMVVAPLTSTLMSSVPGRFSGLGSAINNSISRVGQPLLGAIIFIAISATFYGSLAAKAPDLETGAAAVRKAFQPLNPPPESATAVQVTAATQASIEAFHLSMIVIAALLVIGGLVSWYGLRDGATQSAE